MNRIILMVLMAVSIVVTQGCATYTTPASGVNISSLTDVDIAALMKAEPASGFPARIAVARVQASGYISRTNSGYGSGLYSVVTTRDIEDESDFEKLSSLAMVGGVAPLSRLLLPSELDSIRDLRLSAARLKTDLILIYSIDTAFHVEGTPLGPLSAITLGFLPNKKAFVSSTTSGALIDVRTGFVYGVAEATEREEQRTTIWNSSDAIDEARMDAEKASFKSFIGEFENLWKSTLAQYAAKKSKDAK
ncbi:hypothetical protein [Microbulbifer spongiae]|uniref:DUF3313 domain-containing protein n=1 Tax=Microbulbifer spongiae TaxID=2944933 RepID=A0ABY9E893_9GAMM|nr:hypothetical protein [Microbulbifer sp. MI-G]WKD48367.1 hypothetical protein M8T91_10510 [Microbulbifer sp. MI-G]